MKSDIYLTGSNSKTLLIVGFLALVVLGLVLGGLFATLKIGFWPVDYKALGQSASVEADLDDYMIEDSLPPQFFRRRLEAHARGLHRANRARSTADDLAGALMLSEEVLAVRQRIFDVFEDDAAGDGLGDAYSSLAYAHAQLGSYRAAANARFEAGEIYEGLPDTLETRRDLANQLYFGASALRRLKAYDEAATAFERAFAARQNVLDLAPEAKEDRRFMAILHHEMSLVDRGRSNNDAAMAHVETALVDLRALVEDEPDYERAQSLLRDVLLSGAFTGRVLADEVRTTDFVDELIDNADRHLANDPTDDSGHQQRFGAYEIRFSLQQRAQVPKEVQLATLESAIKDARFVHNARPERQRYAEQLIQMLILYGNLTAQDNDKSVPDKAYAQGVMLARETLSEHPESLRATVALAYGLWYQGGRTVGDATVYENFEASIPLFEEATRAFGQVVQLSSLKQYKLDQVKIWNTFGRVYLELGDDAEAFKAFRQSFQLGKLASDADPDDDVLYRQVYGLAFNMSSLPVDIDEKLTWQRRAQSLLAEVGAAGRLHAEDEVMPRAIGRMIRISEAQQAGATPEELNVIQDAVAREWAAEEGVIHKRNAEIGVGQ